MPRDPRTLAGHSWGMARKRALLDGEQVPANQG